MELEFADRKLRKRCETRKEAVRAWGEACARKLLRRLAEIEAAESLSVLIQLPAARCHALKGDRTGQWAVHLVHPRRLVFEPAGKPGTFTRDGEFRPERVTAVRILEVVDYHD
jgi:toxin HigB-1